MRIPLSAPDITDADIDAVLNAGVAHGVALSSRTAGPHPCLEALGVGENDEVILLSFTFIAAAHAVLYQRAIPV